MLGWGIGREVLDRIVAGVANSRLQRARASLSLRPSPLNLIHYAFEEPHAGVGVWRLGVIVCRRRDVARALELASASVAEASHRGRGSPVLLKAQRFASLVGRVFALEPSAEVGSERFRFAGLGA